MLCHIWGGSCLLPSLSGPICVFGSHSSGKGRGCNCVKNGEKLGGGGGRCCKIIFAQPLCDFLEGRNLAACCFIFWWCCSMFSHVTTVSSVAYLQHFCWCVSYVIICDTASYVHPSAHACAWCMCMCLICWLYNIYITRVLKLINGWECISFWMKWWLKMQQYVSNLSPFSCWYCFCLCVAPLLTWIALFFLYQRLHFILFYSCVWLQDVEKERELRTRFSKEEIGRKIEQYNSSVKDHLKMTLVSSISLLPGAVMHRG